VDEFLAWLHQAQADRNAAEFLFGSDAQHGQCHSIAKWQQAVEKAIKAIVACLRDAGLLHIEIGYRHGVERFVSVLVRLPHAKDNRTIQQQLHGFLDQQTRSGLRALDMLVPRRPAPGDGPQRNTEYPFLIANGRWTYPAAEKVFSDKEIREFRSLAQRVLHRAQRMVSALRRRPK
jgi:HEPN domain-containing protein